ncbi:chemokine XC receptor 1-like [Polymixia lowei]
MNSYLNNSEFDDDYDDELCGKDGVVKFGIIAVPVFFSVVIILSLIGNILVLVILALCENLKSLTNIFILNLAISDLVFTAGLPFWAVYHIWGWFLPEMLCKIVSFVFFCGFYSSVLFLTVMTIHRYLAVVHPLSDHGTQKVSYGVIVSIMLWVISFGAAMPSVLFSAVITIHRNGRESYGCEYNDPLWQKVGTYQQNIFFLAAFVIIGFCYVQILRKIAKTRSHMKNRSVKLIFYIVSVFFLGWVPYNVAIFLKMLADNLVPQFEDCDISTRIDYLFYVCRLIAFSHCCLNPVFYAFVGVKFRSHLKSMLLRIFSHQSSMEEQQQQQEFRMSNVHTNGSMY